MTTKSRKSKRAGKPDDQPSRQAREAIQAWQIDHIKEGLRQADAGEFTSDEEIAAVFAPAKRLREPEKAMFMAADKRK
jgi:predicted transcriptional regulator